MESLAEKNNEANNTSRNHQLCCPSYPFKTWRYRAQHQQQTELLEFSRVFIIFYCDIIRICSPKLEWTEADQILYMFKSTDSHTVACLVYCNYRRLCTDDQDHPIMCQMMYNHFKHLLCFRPCKTPYSKSTGALKVPLRLCLKAENTSRTGYCSQATCEEHSGNRTKAWHESLYNQVRIVPRQTGMTWQKPSLPAIKERKSLPYCYILLVFYCTFPALMQTMSLPAWPSSFSMRSAKVGMTEGTSAKASNQDIFTAWQAHLISRALCLPGILLELLATSQAKFIFQISSW